MEELWQILSGIAAHSGPPGSPELRRDIEAGLEVLQSEGPPRRPLDAGGRPGGLIYLERDRPTVIVPDVHGRVELVLSVLAFSLTPWGIEQPLFGALVNGGAQLLFLGDYVHSEARGARRWIEAFAEFEDGYTVHEAMDAEMAESLTVLRLVARLRSGLPDVVHCLKGNHENVANEHREGNIPFGKFAYEGAMVAEYMRRFYPDALDAVYAFEKALPLLAVGRSFLAGHCEPMRVFDPKEVINHRMNADVVAGLTWTANDAAEVGSVEGMLKGHLPESEAPDSRYFGGHRPIDGLYNLRAEGRYVQLHNPQAFVAAVVPVDRPFDLDVDVVEIPRFSGADYG